MKLWRKGRVIRYAVAILTTFAAYLAQLLIWPFIPPSPQLFFFPAVFVTAWLAGAEAGYVATFLCCVGIAQGFLPPTGIFDVRQPSDVLDLGVFAVVAFGVSATIGRLHTALEREHAAAREAQIAREAVEATWSMVAHDLRTPLNVIQLSSTELERRLPDPGDATERARTERALRAIKRSTNRATDLVEDAVDAMRLANGVLSIVVSPCDVKKLCQEAVDSVFVLAQRKNIALTTNAEGGLSVGCDESRLTQVLSNLLGNAVKFTPAGGSVKLLVRDEGKAIRFAVVDDGPGIPEAELGAIFAKFWTRDRSTGVGLGLWIAKAIVEAHGASLTVESRVGEGTTFSFVLPHEARARAVPMEMATKSQ